MLVTIGLTLLLFGLVIVFHEGGHLLFAKANHIYVEEFAVGMGPKLFSIQGKETLYSLRLLPIGGYCKMPGEDGESEHPNGFDKKSVPQRMLVVFGGAFFNFILAILLFIPAFMLLGAPVDEAKIGEVQQDKPAAVAGIEAGDEIIAIDGVAISSWDEAVTQISANTGTEIALTVARGEETLDFTLTPEIDSETGRGMLGIVRETASITVFGAIKKGFVQTYELTSLILVTLFQMITGVIQPDLAGPVGVGQMVGQVASYGFINFLIFAGAISVNLGVVNLLPIPALDGSRLVFLAIEGIRGRPVSPKVEGTIHFIGFALLMVLMVVITYFDILRVSG